MAKETEQVEAQETETTPQPKHVGFGRYDYDGQRFESKETVQAYIEQKRVEQEDDEEFGPILPEGYDMSIVERPFVYRNSLMELAMNERYAPDGSVNKYYDREWYWGWAADISTDISDKQAKGYRLVGLTDIEAGVKADKIPSHVLSMVREEGSYLVYGDSVLMRMPRVIKRQRDREKYDLVLRRMRSLDSQQKNAFKQAGVGIKDEADSGSNELNIRF